MLPMTMGRRIEFFPNAERQSSSWIHTPEKATYRYRMIKEILWHLILKNVSDVTVWHICLRSVTKRVLILQVMTGTVTLFAGVVAVSSRKGARVHRVAGTVFFVSMLVMAVFADYLAVAIPEQIPNLFIGTLTIYLVATGWLTVRRKERSVGLSEKIALLVVLCLCLPFAVLSL